MVSRGEAALSSGATTSSEAGVGRAVALVGGIALLFYVRTLGFGFVYDDHAHIEWNRFLQDLGNARQLLPWNYIHLRDIPDQNRPLLLASLFLDVALGGTSPKAFHLQSTLWHVLTSVLVLLQIGRAHV